MFYLQSPHTGKGTLAIGDLQVEIYRWDRRSDEARQKVFDSTVPLDRINRLKRPTAIGWGYVMELFWGDIDLLGRDIDVVVTYRSPEGRIVRAQTKTLLVPARRGPHARLNAREAPAAR